jgi:signal peptidase I
MNEEQTPQHNIEQGNSNSIDNKTQKSFLREFFEFAIIALVIVIPFRIYIAQPFVVNGASMDPTFTNGEYLIVDQLSYRFDTPARGSVLIFKYPNDPSKYFIKRVIGLPGETVKSENGQITVINSANPIGIKLYEPYIKFHKEDSFETHLGNSEYFVMGDNRAGSADSRMWGALPEEDIIGRPVIRLFPLSRMDILPGNYDELQ